MAKTAANMEGIEMERKDGIEGQEIGKLSNTNPNDNDVKINVKQDGMDDFDEFFED